VGRFVEITVTDSGVGIADSNITKIFDRFYQIEDTHTREQEGTGIGLALTKELVELHGGAITAKSEAGKGSTFMVQLPLEYDASAAPNRSIGQIDTSSYMDDAETTEPVICVDADGSLPLLLIIEDNTDMRRYIRTNIEDDYRILEATNGAEGVEKAIETVPDLIISDVMMPKMDGFEVCRNLKKDEQTSHIPIILLTAKAGQDHKVEGLETGADDYLVKPFDAKELLVRVNNLLETRKKLREHFQRGLTAIPSGKNIPSADERFLKNILNAIKLHLSDSEFDLASLSDEIAMSRVQMHRKLKAMTGYSPGELIRNVRLQRAAELLKKKTGTVSEIAYEVGFNNLSNFAKLFREKYGVNPSEYSV
jgi:DNA-binding response OmpR family regulator